MSSLVVDGLEKTYGKDTRALVGIRFEVREGEVFGLLGLASENFCIQPGISARDQDRGEEEQREADEATSVSSSWRSSPSRR